MIDKLVEFFCIETGIFAYPFFKSSSLGFLANMRTLISGLNASRPSTTAEPKVPVPPTTSYSKEMLIFVCKI
jgi:hypothetical protein